MSCMKLMYMSKVVEIYKSNANEGYEIGQAISSGTQITSETSTPNDTIDTAASRSDLTALINVCAEAINQKKIDRDVPFAVFLKEILTDTYEIILGRNHIDAIDVEKYSQEQKWRNTLWFTSKISRSTVESVSLDFRWKSKPKPTKNIVKKRRYECYICKKSLTRVLFDLIRHMSTHNGDKPFRCQLNYTHKTLS